MPPSLSATIHVAERFCGGLTEAQKRRLFDEHVEWYRMYGMSMRPVPESWEDFQAYWDHMCRNVLENNHAARAVLDLTELPKPPYAQWVPDWLWVAQRRLLAPLLRMVHCRSLRPTGARPDGLPMVGARRMVAPEVRRLRSSRVCLCARAIPQAPTGQGRPWIAPRDGSLPIRRWYRLPARNLPPPTSATTRCTTAPRAPSDPPSAARYAWAWPCTSSRPDSCTC